MKDVAILIINYRKSDLTLRLAANIMNLEGRERARVIVVDNGATATTRADLATLPAGVEILHEDQNWGYLGGARRGLEHLRVSGPLPKWVIVSNSDIELDAHFLTRLLALDEPVETGILAPTILSGLSGASQNPYMLERPEPQRMHFYKRVFANTVTCFVYQTLGLAKAVARRWFQNARDPGPRREIYAPHGAFMIFSRSYFERGGDFAHAPFLFGEEITVAENCRRLGLKVVFEPSLRVIHIEHASIGVFPSRLLLRCQREASAFCADTYFPLGG